MRLLRFPYVGTLTLGLLIGVIAKGDEGPSPQYGLEWPGDGAARRMLYWHNPFPIYDATYVFKVFPRRKTGDINYYTTFFWGNDGTFTWDGGNGNTYYGAHPYPIPAPQGLGQWEIAVRSSDFVTGTEVEWDRWYTQAFRAWRESPSITHHEFYWDLPDTSKVIEQTIVDPNWANTDPPTPAIVIGQTPDLNGASWGGFAGWEEFNGIIRGIQLYAGVLSVADIQAEIAAPLSTANGVSLIWYLNPDPRPDDVTDKKGVGTPHNPSWAGSPALEWRAGPTEPDFLPPSAPATLGAAATATQVNVTWTAATDNVGVTGYLLERCEGAGCSSFTQIATPTGASFNDTAVVASTGYSYRARAIDAAGNLSGYSNVGSATTPTPDITSPSAPGGLSATPISASQINLSWTAATDNIGITGYRVERCLGPSCSTFAQVATPTAITYADTGLAALTSYSYRVLATDAAGNLSTYSNIATATTPVVTTPAGPAVAYAFNEGTGTSTADASGSGATGVLTNGPTWIAGRNGMAVSFDGSDDKVALPSTVDVAALPFTVEAWVRPANRSTYHVIFSKRSSYSTAGMRFDVGLWQGTGQVYVTTFRSTDMFTYAPPVNSWTHVAIVASSTDTRLYVNGALQQTAAAVLLGTGSGAAVNVGRTGDNDDPYAGAIDDLRLYKRALSLPEIQTDMNTPVGPVGPDTTPPSNPAGLSATAATTTQINVSWTAAVDNVAVTGYLLERCQGSGCSSFSQIATPTGTSINDSAVVASMTYSYRVRAIDAAGNLSGYSNVGSATTPTPDTTPPGAPASLNVTPVSATQINVSWTAATDNVGIANYQLERCQGPGCSSFALISILTTTTTSNAGLTSATSYSYRVRAADAAGNVGAYSAITSATTPSAPDTTAPTPPTALTAIVVSSSQINLSWTASTDNIAVTGYQVDRCLGSGCNSFAQIGTSPAPGFADTGRAASTTYRYRVRATDAAGNVSASSSIITATTQSVPDTTRPTAPGGLSATPISASQINLSWTAATDNIGITGYRVERCLGPSCSTFAQVATPTAITYADTGLAALTSYSYRVLATDAAGNLSTYSNIATATTPVVTTPAGPAVAYAFNEGTGTSTADASGSGATGVLTNGPTWIAGRNGMAVSFDGSDDKVALPSTVDVAALPFTVEAWVRPANRSTYHVIFSKRSSYSTAGMRFDVGLWQGTGQVYVTTFRSTDMFTYAPPVNSWTHVAIVASSTDTRLYVNGALQQTAAAVLLGTGSGAAVNVGRTGDNDDPYAGAIDDLRLYKRALSLPEIQTDMNTPVVP